MLVMPFAFSLALPLLAGLLSGPLAQKTIAKTAVRLEVVGILLEVVRDHVVIIVLSIALLSTESASLYRFGPSNLGAADATPRLTKPPCGGLLSLPTLDL